MVDIGGRPQDRYDDATEGKQLITRRSYLKLSATSVASVAGVGALSGSSKSGTVPDKFDFDRRLHAVDDLGLDPDGESLCDSVVESALSDPGTIIEFPDGTYRFRDMWALGLERAGITNVDGHNPEFVTDHISNVSENIGIYLRGSDLVFSGIIMNYLDRNDGGGPMIYMLAESGDLYAGDIEIRGYFYRRAFAVQLEDPAGNGLMENLAIKDGQRSGRLGSGILVNQTSHNGSLTIRDSAIWHTCSGGIYASPNTASGDTGPVTIENCHFKNNNTASVRVGGTDDVVRSCRFEQTRDAEGGNVTWSNPLPTHRSGHRVPRHIQFRNQGVSNDTVHIEGCEFVYDPPSDISIDGPVRARGDFSGDIEFTSCQVRHEYYDAPAFKMEPGDGSVIFDGLSMVGSGAGNAVGSVFIDDRDESVVKNSCIDLAGSGQNGVYYRSASSVDVVDSNINVPGEAVVFDSSTGATQNVTHSDSCSFDDGGSGDDSTDDGTDGGGNTNDSSDSEVTLSQSMTVRGTGEDVDYTIETTEGIVAGGDDNTVTDPATTVSESVAGDGEDWYWWDSEIVSVSLSDDVEFFINGEQVDPGQWMQTADEEDGSKDDSGSTVTLSQSLTVRGTGEDVDYTIETTEGIVAGGDDNTASDPAKHVSGTAPGDGEDWYWWDGEIVSVTLSGDAEFFINLEQVDPDTVGYPHTIVVDGNNAESQYDFAVTGDVVKSSVLGSIESEDTAGDGTVSGTVADDKDGYHFSGELTSLKIRGDAMVNFD